MAVIVPFETPGKPTSDPLVDLLTPDMERVNAVILTRTGSDVTMIPEVANHLINSGGKRLRPMLTLALARLTGYAGESLLRLAQRAAWCRANGHHLNIEIKPVPGTEEPTGTAVAHAAAALWRGAVSAPLLSSFAPEALAAAQKAQPQLPRALLLDAWRGDALALAAQLGAVALVCNYKIWTLPRVQQAHQAGLRALSYTVNDDAAAQQLQAWGTDGIITDRVDHFDPRTPRP